MLTFSPGKLDMDKAPPAAYHKMLCYVLQEVRRNVRWILIESWGAHPSATVVAGLGVVVLLLLLVVVLELSCPNSYVCHAHHPHRRKDSNPRELGA